MAASLKRYEGVCNAVAAAQTLAVGDLLVESWELEFG
jgi:hypothetical protein